MAVASALVAMAVSPPSLRAQQSQESQTRAQTSPQTSSQTSSQARPPLLTIEPGTHGAPVRRLAVDPQSRIAVTASDDRTARVWDLASGRQLRVLRPPLDQADEGKLYGAAISPDGRLAAVGGSAAGATGVSSIHLFDLATGQIRRSIATGARDIKRIAWSADGRLVAACFSGQNGLRVFTADGSPVLSEPFAGPCFGVAFASNGMLAATDADAGVNLYAQQDGALRRVRHIRLQLTGARAVVFSPDASRLLVGYLGTSVAGRPVADLYDTASGEPRGSITADALSKTGDTYNLWALAWSGDGSTIFAGGRLYRGVSDFVIAIYDARSLRQTAEKVVAGDSVLDLAPLAGDRAAWSSFDGSWGTIDAGGSVRRFAARIADLRGAANLRASASGDRIGWTWAFGRQPAAFRPRERMPASAEDRALQPAVTRRGLAVTNRFENTRQPLVNGARIALNEGEFARALAYLNDAGDAVLGSSQTLRRIDANGGETWSVRVPTEAQAVIPVAGGAAVLAAHADGVLRWWRTVDGALQLSLYPTPDGRWILWTPNGYFDASEGAESLAGWSVDRGPATAADFFSFGRFRARYLRPDIIDRTLDTMDFRRATDEANAELRTSGISPDEERPDAVAQTVAPVTAQTTPPTLVAVDATAGGAGPGAAGGAAAATTAATTAGANTAVRFAVRANSPIASLNFTARVDARPVPLARLVAPAAADGLASGVAELAVPAGSSVIELFARDAFGVSEPLRIVQPAPPPKPLRRSGRLFALVIGISNYRNRDYELWYAAKDANDFVEVLRRNALPMFESVAFDVLTDDKANAESIRRSLEELQARTRAGDTAVVFLAGHGLNDKAGRYYFLPHDGDHRQLQQTAIAGRAIAATLARLPGRTLLFLDTCYAAGILGAAQPGAPARVTTQLSNGLSSPEAGVIVFSSSAGREESQERKEWGNGAFTKVLLDGMRGEADRQRAGQVTHRALDPYVSDGVSRLTGNRQHPVISIPEAMPDFPVTVITH